ncbi:hypothetical protein N782_01745 [Pontibacillus yanchengensis Y32]|uniref:Uncharacterized protein n=1 Tax=Pontibacillus yanchengensis Y32 TaxID=1385514 RepID=A0A0A2T6D2_9BACI|nr:hypothetical protein N782_01745 [Pontibacillus yanchengensis Y32]
MGLKEKKKAWNEKIKEGREKDVQEMKRLWSEGKKDLKRSWKETKQELKIHLKKRMRNKAQPRKSRILGNNGLKRIEIQWIKNGKKNV